MPKEKGNFFFCILEREYLTQFLKQTLTGIFKQLEGELEVAGGPIIRIRNRLLARMVAQIVAHADNLLEVGRGISLTGNVVIVLLIHHGDVVETFEIFRRKLAGPMVKIVSVTLATSPHTMIRQLANMPGTNACRIYQELRVESPLCHQMPHDPVSSWRAADVAQADKQYLLFHFACKGR